MSEAEAAATVASTEQQGREQDKEQGKEQSREPGRQQSRDRTKSLPERRSAQGGGGHDVEFAEQVPRHLVCLICSFAARDAQRMTCCGKIYCRSCVRDLAAKTDKCPNCHKRGLHHAPHCRGDGRVRQLRVRCPRSLRGCGWVGRLEELESVHRLECGKAPVRCPFHEIGCDVRLLREEVGRHKAECLQDHLTCALETLTHTKISHGELKTEVGELKNEVRGLKTEIRELRTEVRELKIKGEDQKRSLVAILEMKEFERHRTAKSSWTSPSFLSHDRGYRLCLRVDLSGTADSHQCHHVSVFVCLLQGANDTDLVWPFRGSVTVDLLNQAGDHTHLRRTVKLESLEPDRGDRHVHSAVTEIGQGWPQFVSLEALEWDPRTNCQYLKDDHLFLRVTQVEAITSAALTSSGSHLC